jgi:hypothetical protein
MAITGIRSGMPLTDKATKLRRLCEAEAAPPGQSRRPLAASSGWTSDVPQSAVVLYSPVGNIGDTWGAEERADERGSFLYVGELRFDLFKQALALA